MHTTSLTHLLCVNAPVLSVWTYECVWSGREKTLGEVELLSPTHAKGEKLTALLSPQEQITTV